MNQPAPHRFSRVLLLAAHPDDETIACGGLLQRASESLVIFATDGAPPHYGFEKEFGSLENYSAERFREATRALALIPECSFRRLSRPNGTYFQDQHLFLELPEAFSALRRAIGDFAPDILVSHSYEGGHLDHDACNFLAAQAATQLEIERLEFPLYSKDVNGRDVFQQFRDVRSGAFSIQLTACELDIKRRMFAMYRTQEKVFSFFTAVNELFRPAAVENYSQLPPWLAYPFENRRKALSASVFTEKLAKFNPAVVLPTGNF
jgi:LmbE family N-acetylglucosaminyl deacetylase